MTDAAGAPLCGDPTCEGPGCRQSAIDDWEGRMQRYARDIVGSAIGRAVVRCPSCDTERWHGLGPCSTCGAPGTADDTEAESDER
jgi:hypothetical protein